MGLHGTYSLTLLNPLLVLDTSFMDCLCVGIVLHPHFAIVAPKHGVGLPKLRSNLNLRKVAFKIEVEQNRLICFTSVILYCFVRVAVCKEGLPRVNSCEQKPQRLELSGCQRLTVFASK